MNFLAASFFLLLVLDGSTGVLVGPVQLVNRQRYIKFSEGASPDTSLVRCPYTLEDGEGLQDVYWKFARDGEELGAFTWRPEEGGEATGVLDGYVRLDRDDGELELTELVYGLTGEYMCGVTTSEGHQQETAPWQVVIAEQTGSGLIPTLDFDYDSCLVSSSLEVYAVFPEPTVHAGLYSSELGGFYDKVSPEDWSKVVHENQSVSYSYSGATFLIDPSTPDDAEFMVTVGLTKADHTYISLDMMRFSDDSLIKKGCPNVRTRAYQVVEYNTPDMSCRGKHLPQDSESLTAHVSCDEDHEAEGIGHEDHTIVACDIMKEEWVPSGDGYGHRDFICVSKSGVSRITSWPILAALLSLLLRMLH